MNAHSVVCRYARVCTPTQEDYERFRGMTFLHNQAPLFGTSDESLPIAAPVKELVIQTPATTRPQVLLTEPLTTPKFNNVATPFLRTPEVAVRSPQARVVTIMELLAIEAPEKVRIGSLELQVEINIQKGPVFKLPSNSRFYVSRFEVCCLAQPSCGRISKEASEQFSGLHKTLRSLFIGYISGKAAEFRNDPEFLRLLAHGQYVKVGRGRKSVFFKVTGEKREKRLEYVTSLKTGLRVKFGTSIKVRRLPNGEPTGSPEEDKLLEFFQRQYA